MNSGIYEIRNKINGRRYIGSTGRLSIRFLQHRSRLRQGSHDNHALQAAWRKYGEAAFEYRALALCARELLLVMEQAVFDELAAAGERTYNIATQACSGAKGRVPSAETRAKQSASVMATYTAEKRAAHSAIIKARSNDPDYLLRMSERRKAAWAAKTEAERDRIRAARAEGVRAGHARRKAERAHQRRSDARKAVWANPEKRARILAGMRAPSSASEAC